MKKKLYQLLLPLLLLASWSARGQRVQLQQESFEVAPGAVGSKVDVANTRIYTTAATGSTNAYFLRTTNAALTTDAPGYTPAPVGGTLDGSGFWVGEDVQGIPSGTPNSPAFTPAIRNTTPRRAGIVTLNSVSISGYASLQVSLGVLVARSVTSRMEQDDTLQVQVRFNGAGLWTTVGQLVGDQGNGAGSSGSWRVDANLNGRSDDDAALPTPSPAAGATMSDFTFDIAGSGSSLQTRVVVAEYGGSEEFAFDNIRVSGIASTNQAPVLANIEGTTIAYSEGGAPTQITNALTVSDPDNTTLTDATVKFTAGFDNTEDRLLFTNQNGISGSYNTGTGILTLSGTATLAAYQVALRSIRYQDIDAADATPGTRTVAFSVSDGITSSLAVSRDITVTVALNAATGLPYTEDFTSNGEGTTYGSNHFSDTGNGAGFERTNVTPDPYGTTTTANTPTTFTNISNGYYWFGSIVKVRLTGEIGTLVTQQINTSGYASLQFSLRLGATSNAWESDDYFKLYYRANNGSWVIIGSFRSTDQSGGFVSSTGNLRQDATPGATTGVPTGTQLGAALQTFSFALPASINGQLLDFKIEEASNTKDGNGEVMVFDLLQLTGTLLGPSTVTTTAAGTITSTSAVLGGNVTADGGATVTDRGVVYSATNATPTVGGSGVTQAANGTGTGAFSATIASLTPGTTYYVRAYAINSVGTSYGTVSTFTTTPNAPVVTAPVNGSLLNTATPTYSGTAVASATVTVYVDGTAIGTTTATAGGNFSLAQPAALAQGSHTVRATAQTSGSAVSANSNTNTFAIDTVAPTVAISSTAGALGGTTSTTPIPFTVTFSKGVTGFNAGSVVVSNGTLSGFAGAGTTYIFNVTPTTAGTVTTVNVAANVAQDAAGNGNTAAPQFAITYQPGTLSWTGLVSTDWFTAGNWSAGVPTSVVGAIIPAAAPNMPLIAAGTATTKSLTLNAGSTLTQTGGTLDVRANLTNNGSLSATGGAVVLGSTTLASVLGSSNTRFWNLTTGSSGAQSGTSALTSVQRLLTLNGNFSTQGNPLTLESNASATALVVNNASNAIIGNVTVQRYIAPDLNAGLGYRHFSAPISTATVASLATGSFTPLVNGTYNTSATPTAVTPFPTVYGYDQARLATATNNLVAFDKGWFSPNSLGDALTVGQGYTVNLAANQTLSVTGPQNNGNVLLNLSRNSGGTASDAGWQLVGNPYPSPLDYSLVALADRPNLDAAIYVFESTSQYAGSYRANVNSVGGNANSPNAVLAQGQGFFVRVSTGQTSSTLTLRNSQRPTAYANPVYHRTTETRPLVQFDLHSATGTDPVYVYFENGATAGVDREFDAVKLPNSNGLNVSAETGVQRLAINALPTLGTATVTVPLTVGVPAAGSFSFNAAQLLNLGTTPVYLRDRQTGAVVDLARQPSYNFVVSNAAALVTGRFELVFSPQAVLATAPAALAAQVGVYPNPASKAVFVELPFALNRKAVTAALVDALGRVVLTQALPAGLPSYTLPLTNLATGVYSLRFQTEAGVVVKKLVVE